MRYFSIFVFSLLGSLSFAQSEIVFNGEVSGHFSADKVTIKVISNGMVQQSIAPESDGSFELNVPVGMNSTVLFRSPKGQTESLVINTENVIVDLEGYYTEQTLPFVVQFPEGKTSGVSRNPNYVFFNKETGALEHFENKSGISEQHKLLNSLE